MVNGIEDGTAPHYAWYDEDNDVWYFAQSLADLRSLWSEGENANGEN